MKWGILTIILCYNCCLLCQSGFTSLGGANFVGYGRAGVTLKGIEAIYMNQAGLTDVKNISFDISAEKKFNLPELSNISIACAKTLKIGTFGLLLSNFGFSEYNEQKFAIAYARKLGSNISIGGQFDILRFNIAQFGSKNIYTFEVGIQIRLNSEFSLATHIFSPGNINIAEGSDLGTRFRMGIQYKPSAKVFLMTEIDKMIYRQAEFKIGLSYQAIKELQLRLGVIPVNNTFSFGAMFFINNQFKAATGYALNSNLGNSPAVSLQYLNTEPKNLKNKTN